MASDDVLTSGGTRTPAGLKRCGAPEALVRRGEGFPPGQSALPPPPGSVSSSATETPDGDCPALGIRRFDRCSDWWAVVAMSRTASPRWLDPLVSL